MLAGVVVLYFLVPEHGFPEERARAMAFSAMVLGNASLILSNRSLTRSMLSTLTMPNRALWWAVAGALGGLARALYVPPMQRVFRFETPHGYDPLLCLLAASTGVLWSEIVKVFARVRSRRSSPLPEGGGRWRPRWCRRKPASRRRTRRARSGRPPRDGIDSSEKRIGRSWLTRA